MKRKILTTEKIVIGPSFLGWDSSITFRPAGKPGWYLQTEDGLVPLDHRIVFSKKGRLQAKYGKTKIETIEHPMALKMLIGLDEVILDPKGKSWPPYIGGAGGYEKQLSGCWVQTNSEFPTIKPVRNSRVQEFNNLATEVQIEKNNSGELNIILYSHWKPLPAFKQKILLGDEIQTKDILKSKPQGFPAYREYFADLLVFFGWPNKDYVSWISDFNSLKDASYAWWCHAAQDSLGELALAHYKKIPSSAKILRFCAGHKQTLQAVKESFS